MFDGAETAPGGPELTGKEAAQRFFDALDAAEISDLVSRAELTLESERIDALLEAEEVLRGCWRDRAHTPRRESVWTSERDVTGCIRMTLAAYDASGMPLLRHSWVLWEGAQA